MLWNFMGKNRKNLWSKNLALQTKGDRCCSIGPPCSLFFCFCVSLSSIIFFIFVTLIMDIFYCVNYTSVLLHLFTTYFVSHLALSCITYSISALIINIFYGLACISLLLHLIIAQLVINFIITLSLTYVLGNYYDLYKYR